MEPKIIYEDNDLLVVDKPSGLLTHRVSKSDDSPTVVSWLLEHYPEVADVYSHDGQDLEWESMRSGIVHRLDKETSGLLVIAKNQLTFEYLKNLFKDRKIKKTYLALVYGHFKQQNGTIEAPIGKYRGKQTTRTVVGRNFLKEKPAITDYQVVKEYSDFSLVEASPMTGRTHQIRVHLKSIGHSVVCDKLYSTKKQICPTGLGRLFLHAQKLELVTPSGENLTLETDLPQELSSFLETLPKNEN